MPKIKQGTQMKLQDPRLPPIAFKKCTKLINAGLYHMPGQLPLALETHAGSQVAPPAKKANVCFGHSLFGYSTKRTSPGSSLKFANWRSVLLGGTETRPLTWNLGTYGMR